MLLVLRCTQTHDGALNIHHIRTHWDDVLRLTTSIKQGTVTASLMLRKLASYPCQRFEFGYSGDRIVEYHISEACDKCAA